MDRGTRSNDHRARGDRDPGEKVEEDGLEVDGNAAFPGKAGSDRATSETAEAWIPAFAGPLHKRLVGWKWLVRTGVWARGIVGLRSWGDREAAGLSDCQQAVCGAGEVPAGELEEHAGGVAGQAHVAQPGQAVRALERPK